MIKSENGTVDMYGTGADIMTDIICAAESFLEEAPRMVRGIIAAALKNQIDKSLERIEAKESGVKNHDGELDDLISRIINGYKEEE